MDSRRKFHKLLLALGVLLLFGLSAISSVLDSTQRHTRFRDKKSAQLMEHEVRKGEPGPTDPDGALKFRRLQLQDEKGVIPPDGLEKARRHVELMKTAQQARPKKEDEQGYAGIRRDSWSWLGPGNIGGRVRSIVISPANANNMWVGSVSGGIWRTINGGASWFPVNDFLANLAVSTMLIDPANSNTLYAGTGEGFGNIDAIQGAGVFKSTDGGVNWNQVASTANNSWFFVNRLAISPTGNIILAANSPVRDANGNLVQNGGIWRSTDSGATWSQSTVTQTFDVNFRSNTQAIAGGAAFAQFSTDGGQTWTAASFNPALSPPSATNNGRVEVEYNQFNPDIAYAAVNQNNGDIYRSTDGGQNYTRVNTGTNFFLGGAGTQGWYDNVIWVHPSNSNFVLVGGIHLWRSTDGGATFTQISNGSLVDTFGVGSPHADHHVIVAHPGFDNSTNFTVFFGNDGGIYRTENVTTATQTSGWVELNNNFGVTQFYGAAGNANSGLIIGGAQDNGTLAGGFNTETWTSVFGNDGGFCAADPTNSNYFYGESQRLQINRSDNGGVSAVNIFAGITDANNCPSPGVCNSNFIAPFVLDPNDPNRILAGGLSLWRSTDVKEATPTWSQIKAPTGANSNGCPRCISAIAISPGTSSFILVGHNDGDIYKTTNGAVPSPTWTKIDTAALPNNRVVTRLVIDNTRTPNWIYATFGGFSADNVYRSTDLGGTWTDITGTGVNGLPNVPVRSLVYHPRNPNLLYVGTEVGIFSSDDAGANWEVMQGGPANVSVDELFWLGNDLVAATHGRGIYRASGGIYVDCNYNGVQLGTFDQPFKTVTAAVNATTRYQIIWIKPCNYNETFPSINRGLELHSLGGTVVIGRP